MVTWFDSSNRFLTHIPILLYFLVCSRANPRPARPFPGLFYNVVISCGIIWWNQQLIGTLNKYQCQHQTQARSERILGEIKGIFLMQRGVWTLQSVQRPYGKAENIFQIERKLRSMGLIGDQEEERSVPFNCAGILCWFHRWVPSGNTRIGDK